VPGSSTPINRQKITASPANMDRGAHAIGSSGAAINAPHARRKRQRKRQQNSVSIPSGRAPGD
jgi:hypothetical protein